MYKFRKFVDYCSSVFTVIFVMHTKAEKDAFESMLAHVMPYPIDYGSVVYRNNMDEEDAFMMAVSMPVRRFKELERKINVHSCFRLRSIDDYFYVFERKDTDPIRTNYIAHNEE